MLANAQSTSPQTFEITPQNLRSALTEFARQSGTEILYSPDIVSDKRSPGVRGKLDPISALTKLLFDSGLTFTTTPQGAILLQPATQPAAKMQTIALLQESASASNQSVSDSVPQRSADSADAVPSVRLEEVVVTGTNIRGVDISAPTTTITRSEINKTGFVTLESLLESIPQNFDGVTPDGRYANEGGGFVAVRNNERAAAIDLRGLGPQSTLTLLNGTRRASSVGGRVVDVSMIPLAAIERVELVTGGRSAIYGSDAVAGVVNFVTRREFDGAETQASFTTPTEYPGGERIQASQIFGHHGDRGGFVVAYDYTREYAMNLADTGLMTLAPSSSGQTYVRLEPQSNARRHSGLFSGKYSVTNNFELFVDGLYTDRMTDYFEQRIIETSTEVSSDLFEAPATQYSASLGARVGLPADWSLNVTGTMSRARNSIDSFGNYIAPTFRLDYDYSDRATSKRSSTTVVAEGPLFTVGGITPRAAVGVEYGEDAFSDVMVADGFTYTDIDRKREVSSTFAEIAIPLVKNGARRPGLRNLELSVAGRYDDYSDFGDTFNPQFGLTWGISEQVGLRAAYATAFRAPSLIDLGTDISVFIEAYPDPDRGGVAIPTLVLQGNNPDLKPEEAKTWSVSLDFTPSFLPDTRIVASYFHVNYDKRLEQPVINADRRLVFQFDERYPGLLNRTPTQAEVDAFIAAHTQGAIYNGGGQNWDPASQNVLDVYPNLATLDNRINNIAVEKLSAVDLRIDTRMPLMGGSLSLGLDGTYTLDHTRNITATSPAVTLLNQVGKPVDLRVRAKAGWSRAAYSGHLFVNYLDKYENPFATPTGTMASWTTLDLTLGFNGSELATNTWLSRFSATLSATNLLDRQPPFFPNSFLGVKYDSANASYAGRIIGIRLIQRW